MRRIGTSILVLALLAIPVRSASEPAPEPAATESAARPSLLLGDAYPIEAAISFQAALLHWLDSLAALAGPGMTAGKTVEAHRMDYRQQLGSPTEADMRQLRRFADARMRLASDDSGSADLVTAAFLEEPTLTTALERAASLLDDATTRDLRTSLEHFTPGYRAIWREGQNPEQFLRRVIESPDRAALAGFLRNVARFYGVDETPRPLPRLVLTPVRPGHGTHAQAVGRNLLIEVRKGEGLTDQVGPIVHENAHFLFGAIDPARRAELRAHAEAQSKHGLDAWETLREALPTALAQGAAEQRFRRGWSARNPWYHRPDIDRHAKAIFPLVLRALEKDGTFDETFVEQAVAAYWRNGDRIRN